MQQSRLLAHFSTHSKILAVFGLIQIFANKTVHFTIFPSLFKLVSTKTNEGFFLVN